MLRHHSISFDRFFWLGSFSACCVYSVCESFAASTLKVQ